MAIADRDAARRPFQRAAREALGDRQLRANLARATATIRARRAVAVSERPDWEALREAGHAVRLATLERLDELLVELEAAVVAAGGTVHWARDAREARETVVSLVAATGADEVVKVKSLTTDEIGLNRALEAAGIRPLETDLAELIVQLAGERPSHLLVPAVHKNRSQIRDLFRTAFAAPDLGDDPAELADAARRYLREAFMRARVAISGANFLVAETGSAVIVESEGNGRMCTSLPPTLITVAGIEKVVPTVRDLGVLLQLLPPSATGEAMSPYTTLWSGVRSGEGPGEFHLVLVDAGRTRALADERGRHALLCIRCGACLNVCPVYRQTGGHPYHTPYGGPIGAVLAPQTDGVERAGSLPFASTLCGACYDVCPVKIDIPALLGHLRGRVVEERGSRVEGVAMRLLARAFYAPRRYERVQRLARSRTARSLGSLLPGPLRTWTRTRALPPPPSESFRDWWQRTQT